MHCQEPIEVGDPGVTMPVVRSGGAATIEPAHVECFLRSVLGSVDHLHGQCLCHSDNPVSSELSWREQGKLLMLEIGPR